jgi:hypothetical protein
MNCEPRDTLFELKKEGQTNRQRRERGKEETKQRKKDKIEIKRNGRGHFTSIL